MAGRGRAGAKAAGDVLAAALAQLKGALGTPSLLLPPLGPPRSESWPSVSLYTAPWRASGFKSLGCHSYPAKRMSAGQRTVGIYGRGP